MVGDEVIWWSECEQAAPPVGKKSTLRSLVKTAFPRFLLAKLPYVECLQYNAVKNANWITSLLMKKINVASMYLH